MVFFYKDPNNSHFTVYQGNTLSVDPETGEISSFNNPVISEIENRADPGRRPANNEGRVNQMLSVLNAAAARARENVYSDDSCYEGSDSDDYEDCSDTEVEEIESNDLDKISIRKGDEVQTYAKFKESSPRRHALFEDVKSLPDDKDTPTIHFLDDNSMNAILSHVDVLSLFKLSTVCKRWYNLCTTRLSSMTKLSILQVYRDLNSSSSDEGDVEEEKKVKRVLTQSNLVTILSATNGNLRELYLDTQVGRDGCEYSIHITKEISTAVSRYCRGLESLVIEFNKLGGLVGLESFAKHLPAKNQLKSLALKGDKRKKDGKILTENHLGDFLKKAKGLQRLHIEASDLIGGSSIIKYLKNHTMMSFSFCNCKNLDTDLLEFILKHHHQSLEHLSFYTYAPMSPSDFDYELVTNSTTLSITEKSPKLTKLRSFWAMKYDDCLPLPIDSNVNLSLLRLMPNLVELDLSFNLDLDEDPLFLRSLAAMCPVIEVLKLCGANIGSVRSMKPLENMFFLRELDLENVCCNYEGPRWSMFDFEGFAKGIVPLLKALCHLNLSSTDVDDSAILSIIKNNHSVSFIDVTSNSNSDDPIDGSFIEKCHGINRTSPITVAMEIDEKEMKKKALSKLKAAIDKSPKFLTIKTDYMNFPELKGWYNEHFNFSQASLF